MFTLELTDKDGGSVFDERFSTLEFETIEQARIAQKEVEDTPDLGWDHGVVWVGAYITDENGKFVE